jgi:hypothetical protein
MWLTDLADACRKSGLPVAEQSGWKTRGHGGLSGVSAIICHHTAGPATGEAPSLGVVQNGRTGLPGPLSQLVLGRSGTVYVVAAGLAYHAGTTFQSWQGNAYTIGIEAEATGTSPWPAVQYEAYVRLCKALADHYRVPYDRVLGHKEVASPLGRKIDPNLDMAAFRAAVNNLALVGPAERKNDMEWTTVVGNMNGDQVQVGQVINGIERRTADAQNQIAAVERKVDEVLAKLADYDGPVTDGFGELPVGEPLLDLDAIAAKVADLISARLAS